MQVFDFNQGHENGCTHKCVVLPEGATWSRVVAEFAEFLSGIYGYDIKEKLIVNIGGEYVPLRQQQLDEALAEEF